jgi:hypothetical protein
MSDLDVVHRDKVFAIRSYDEMLLVCLIVHLDVPYRCPIDQASG